MEKYTEFEPKLIEFNKKLKKIPKKIKDDDLKIKLLNFLARDKDDEENYPLILNVLTATTSSNQLEQIGNKLKDVDNFDETNIEGALLAWNKNSKFIDWDNLPQSNLHKYADAKLLAKQAENITEEQESPVTSPAKISWSSSKMLLSYLNNAFEKIVDTVKHLRGPSKPVQAFLAFKAKKPAP